MSQEIEIGIHDTHVGMGYRVVHGNKHYPIWKGWLRGECTCTEVVLDEEDDPHCAECSVLIRPQSWATMLTWSVDTIDGRHVMIDEHLSNAYPIGGGDTCVASPMSYRTPEHASAAALRIAVRFGLALDELVVVERLYMDCERTGAAPMSIAQANIAAALDTAGPNDIVIGGKGGGPIVMPSPPYDHGGEK